MYYCNNCNKNFDYVKIKPVTYFGQVIRKKLCPFCDSEDFYEKKGGYCRLCGIRLKYIGKQYCSESCKKQGEALFNKQKLRKENPTALLSSLCEVELYNKRTGLQLSYGQYYALKGVGKI